MTKQARPATATLLARIKRTAKRRKREEDTPHHQTLEAEARQAGFDSWHALEKAASEPRADLAALPIDPALRDGFDSTPHEDRPAAEIAEWWERPYLVSNSDGSYIVRCLDGGAWDRSTFYGRVKTIEEGARLAADKLRRWQNAMRSPVLYVDTEGRTYAVRFPSRPEDQMEVMFGPGSKEEVGEFIREWNAANSSPS